MLYQLQRLLIMIVTISSYHLAVKESSRLLTHSSLSHPNASLKAVLSSLTHVVIFKFFKQSCTSFSIVTSLSLSSLVIELLSLTLQQGYASAFPPMFILWLYCQSLVCDNRCASCRQDFHLDKRGYKNAIQPSHPITDDFSVPPNAGKISLSRTQLFFFTSSSLLLTSHMK